MDLFKCGICHEEFNSIKDFYDHKANYRGSYKCNECKESQFHLKEQLLVHQQENHSYKESSEETDQINLLVEVDGDAGYALDPSILAKLLEISQDGQAVQIIVNDSDGDGKESKEKIEVLYIQNSEIEDDQNKFKENLESGLHRQIYLCVICNHFSYQKEDVINHLLKVHNKTFEHSEADKWIQELALLHNSDDEVQQESNQTLNDGNENQLQARTVEPSASVSIEEISLAHYCAKCHCYFDNQILLDEHICAVNLTNTDESGTESGADNLETSELDANAEVNNQETNAEDISSKKMITYERSKPLCPEKNILLLKNKSNVAEVEVVEKGDLIKKEMEPITDSCADDLYTEVLPKNGKITGKQTKCYKCKICSRVAFTLPEIRTHCLTHTDLRPYKCCKCRFSTRVKSLLIKHLKRHMKQRAAKNSTKDVNEEYECEICLVKFSSMMALVLHIRKFHTASDRGRELFLTLVCQKLEEGKSSGLYRCVICETYFKEESECTQHVQLNHISKEVKRDKPDLVSKTWKCFLCNHTTTYMRPFLKHISVHKLIYRCSICFESLISSALLHEHMEKEHVIEDEEEERIKKIEELICNSLNTSWYLSEDITERISSVVTEAYPKVRDFEELDIMTIIEVLQYKPLSQDVYSHIKQTTGHIECHHCGRLFFTQAELNRHIGIHALEKKHKCPKCDYTSATRENLRRHIAKIHEKTVYKCSDCDYSTMCKTTMWKHKKSHQKKIECSECHEEFEKSKSLRQHMIDRHLHCIKATDDPGNNKKSIGGTTFKCPICFRQFHRSILEFKRHMWIHEGVKPFKCKLCTYKCRTANHLEVHMRKHSSLKPFQCPTCYKDFKSKSSLQYHIQRFHSATQQVLYACDKCEYSTAQKGHLKVHQRNHLIVRKFSCNLCYYSANTLSSLKAHYKKKHKGIPFPTAIEERTVCNVPQDLDSATNSTDSTQVQVGIRVFKCDTCDYRFTSVTEFRRHLKSKHGLINFKWDEVEVLQ